VTLKSLLEDAPEDWPLLAGVADPRVTVIDADIAALAHMENLAQLEALATKLLRAESWDELLPQPRKSARRKKGGA